MDDLKCEYVKKKRCIGLYPEVPNKKMNDDKIIECPQSEIGLFVYKKCCSIKSENVMCQTDCLPHDRQVTVRVL